MRVDIKVFIQSRELVNILALSLTNDALHLLSVIVEEVTSSREVHLRMQLVCMLALHLTLANLAGNLTTSATSR